MYHPVKRFMHLCLAAWLLTTLAAHAKDDNGQLYDAVAPADAGFVRLFNLTRAPVEVKLSGKSASQTVGAESLGKFLFAKPGTYTLTVNQSELTLDITTRTAHTVVWDGQRLSPLTLSIPANARKAWVSFINLSDTALSLKTADGRFALVDNLPPGHIAGRAINEIKIRLAAYATDTKLKDFDELFMRKGRSYTFAVFPGAQGPGVLSTPDTVDPIE